jgi:hypothetical protein
MPPVQTTYNDTPGAAVAGALATMIGAVLLSRTVETSAGIGFGVAVEQGAADKGCKVFDGGVVLGITVMDRSASGLNPATGARTADTFGHYESARVMTKGDIWLTCTTGCATGDPIYVRPSNNTFQNSSANSAVQIAGRWETSAGAGALAVARLT